MDLKNKIMNLYKQYNNKYAKPITRKIVRLLKIILVDEEIDLNKISEIVPIGINTIEKYATEESFFKGLITSDEYKIFQNKVNYIFDEYKKNLNKNNINLLSNLIDDILNTRYKLEDICKKNYIHINKFYELLLDKTYIDDVFGKGTKQKIKERLQNNKLIRLSVPRNEYIVEDRYQIIIAKDEITHLNSSDLKRLSLAASYLYSKADLNTVSSNYQISPMLVVSLLSEQRIKIILKEEYYLKIKKYMNIENVLLGNNILNKKKLINNIIDFLDKNDYDRDLALAYFDIPLNLFNRILNEIIEVTYVSDKIKDEIKNILEIENEKKVK